MDPPPIKPRNPWLAGVISLVAPGLGQVYNGQLRKGVVYLVFVLLIVPVLLVVSPPLTIAGFVLLLAVILYLILDAVIVARAVGDHYRLKPYNNWYSYMVYAACLLFLKFFIKDVFVQSYVIPSRSMLPTLEIGDHISVNKLEYGVRKPLVGGYLLTFTKPHRGDLVVFVYPQDRSKPLGSLKSLDKSVERKKRCEY